MAQQLVRASPTTAAKATQTFLEFWEQDGRQHFCVEEEILLPAYAPHASHADTAVARVLAEHVDIRRRAADLATADSPTLQALHELGERMLQHIRHKERMLFPMIEDALPEAALRDLAMKIARSEDAA